MAAPTPSVFVNSGNKTATTSWPVTHPAYSVGDLILFHVASDADVLHDWSATGPDGETVFTIVDSHGSAAFSNERVSAFGYVATAARAQGTVTVTPNASEQWTATTLVIPAGDFNAATPIDSVVGTGGATSGTSAPTPAWTTSSAVTAGRPIVWIGVNTDPIGTGVRSGWSQLTTFDRGAVSGTLGYRTAAAGPSESIASVNWGLFNDSSSTLGYVINEPANQSFESGGSTTVTSVIASGLGIILLSVVGGSFATLESLVTGNGFDVQPQHESGGAVSTVEILPSGSGLTIEVSSLGSISQIEVTTVASGTGSEEPSNGSSAIVSTSSSSNGIGVEKVLDGSAILISVVTEGNGFSTQIQSESNGSVILVLTTVMGGGETSQSQNELDGSLSLVSIVNQGSGLPLEDGIGSATVNSTISTFGSGAGLEFSSQGQTSEISVNGMGNGLAFEVIEGGATIPVLAQVLGMGISTEPQNEGSGSVIGVDILVTGQGLSSQSQFLEGSSSVVVVAQTSGGGVSSDSIAGSSIGIIEVSSPGLGAGFEFVLDGSISLVSTFASGSGLSSEPQVVGYAYKIVIPSQLIRIEVNHIPLIKVTSQFTKINVPKQAVTISVADIIRSWRVS